MIYINFLDKNHMPFMAITSFTGRWRFLSNFYPAKIKYRGIEYPTVEHFYVSQKIKDDQFVNSKIDLVQSVGGWNSYFYSNNDFTLNKSKTLFASVNYGLQLPGRYQIFQISTMHMLDISVQALFFKKKLSLGLTWRDVLNGQRPVISYYSNGIKTTAQGYDDSRSLRVSISYKFGNDNLKSKERNFGNEEEQNRAN